MTDPSKTEESSTAELLSPPRGMRDFYPEDMALRNRIFETWRASARRFSFQEYDACVVESLALLKRKAGEEIVDQIYEFVDKSGRPLALRPEMTPTLARMVAARFPSLQLPIKWFTVGQCFRYERMSRGRKREHYQWNLDIVGEPTVAAEAEVVACAVDAMTSLGLSPNHYVIRFSSRPLLTEILRSLGVPEDRHRVTAQALDKLGKVELSEVRDLLRTAGLDASSIDRFFALTEASSFDAVEGLLNGPSQALADLRSFLLNLESYGVRQQVRFDLTVVRGLAYYTGIVFEAFDAQRKFRAIFGGGRYDNLLSDVGGKQAPAVGLGFGDVVIADLLTDLKIPSPATPVIRLAVGYMDDPQRDVAMRCAASLRRSGLRVDLGLHSERARNFFARVSKGNFERAVYLGPDDVTARAVRIKDLLARTETSVSFQELGLV